jgi:hypothetical protein
MEFYETEVDGIPWKIPWNSMEINGISWNSIHQLTEFNGIPFRKGWGQVLLLRSPCTQEEMRM